MSDCVICLSGVQHGPFQGHQHAWSRINQDLYHEGHEFLGYGTEVSVQISDTGFPRLDVPIRRAGVKFSYIPYADPLERDILPQDEDILSAARSLAICQIYSRERSMYLPPMKG